MPSYTPVDTGVKRSVPRAKAKARGGEPERELQSRIEGMLQDAKTFSQSELAPFREKATKYYRGEPFGNEEDGRSRFVLTEVRDAILQKLPSLMRIFFGPEGVVEFAPKHAGVVDEARVQTAAVRHVFEEDNPGFTILYTCFKDAMARRLGVVKYWWEEQCRVESRRLTGISEEEWTILEMTADPEVEYSEVEKQDDGTYSLSERRETKDGRVRIELVDTDEFLYNRSATSLKDAILVAHQTRKTVGELVALGYDEEEVRDARSYGAGPPTAEKTVKKGNRTTWQDEAAEDENAPVLYTEAYVLLDMRPYGGGSSKRPGTRELRKICTIGEGYKIVANEPANRRPFALFICDPEPNELVGLSTADSTMDLQLLNSMIARGILDSLNLSLNPRTGFIENAVNLQDLMNTEIGALVRMKQPNALQPIEHRFVGADGLAVLTHFQDVKQDREGVTRAAAGLNPDALQSSTVAAVGATVEARAERTELLARVFAETGMKDLFRGIYETLREHQSAERTMRLLGQWVPVSPRNWPPVPEVVVKVGIGSGTKDQQLEILAGIIAKQEQAIASYGIDNPLVDLKLYRDTLAEAAMVSGRPDASRYFKEITNEQLMQLRQQAAQAAAQQPQDPAMVLAEAQVQIDQQKLQIDAAKMQAEEQRKQGEAALGAQKASDDSALKWETLRLEDERERLRIEADIMLRAAEIEAKHGVELQVAGMKVAVDRETKLAKAAIDAVSAEKQAETKAAVDLAGRDSEKEAPSGESE